MWPLISTVVSKLQDLSRSQAVKHTVKVIMSQKLCKIGKLLLQTTTRMWANAQPDGHPAEHKWRPLFNAPKFG